MQLSETRSEFTPCPEYTGRAVCVDVTPLKKVNSPFGEREVFKVVFETELEREDGSRFCAWSRNFTPTLNERANFRKFVQGWYGRELTKEELGCFETESLVGRTAQLVVVHEHKDGETYANIVACRADRDGEPMEPCGKYVRVADRKPRDIGSDAEPAERGGSYRRAQPVATDATDLGATKIHVGRCKGLELRDLSPEQVRALIEHWLESQDAVKKTVADKRLAEALEWWQETHAEEEDNVPY